MKRDMALSHRILLRIEAYSKQRNVGSSRLIADFAPEEVGYYLILPNGAGLIQACSRTALSGRTDWTTERLTWQGHEFLDAARDQKTWNQAKKTISEKGGSLTFDVLKAVLAQVALKQVGL